MNDPRNRNRTPGAPFPPQQPNDPMAHLTDKVAQKYGAFGARPDDEEADRKVLQDNFLKPTL